MRNLIVILGLLVFACQSKPVEKAPTQTNPVDALSTPESQKAYLEGIYDLGQKTREESKQTAETKGYESLEAAAAMQKMLRTNRENLQKINAYLQRYDHPKKDIHGKKATKTPLVIIQYTGNIAAREENFSILYSAYEAGEIDEEPFYLYLDRSHRIKFGKSLFPNEPINYKEEIERLVKALNFES